MARTKIPPLGLRNCRIGVIGLGYVGLPLAVEFAREGFSVTGIDVDRRKVDTLLAGRSHVEDVPPEVVAPLVRARRLRVQEHTDSRGVAESIAANLDQLGIVVAPRPACDPFIVDRYVAGACYAGISPLLIVNKSDLPADAGDLGFVEPLRALGFPVLFVSARTGDGLPDLIAALRGKRTLLAGQSGVGKSSVLNTLAGAAVRATGRLSERSSEGRHTTVSSAIVRLPWGELAGSPGVRDYAPPGGPLRDVQGGPRWIGTQ